MAREVWRWYTSAYTRAQRFFDRGVGWRRTSPRCVAHRLHTYLGKLVRSMAPNPVAFEGLAVCHDASTWRHIFTLMSGRYEPHVMPVFKQRVAPGMTVVDLGAHLGMYTLLAAARVGPGGRVYAFEPDPRVLPLLRRNVQVNGYAAEVRVVAKAVGRDSGIAQLFLSKETGSTSVLGASRHEGTPFVVEAVSLDDFFREEGWPKVHLIKMDLEGAERLVLEGMRCLSAKNPTLTLLMELNWETMQGAGTTPQILFALLSELGFSRLSALDAVTDHPYRLTSPSDLEKLAGVASLHHHIPHLLGEKG